MDEEGVLGREGERLVWEERNAKRGGREGRNEGRARRRRDGEGCGIEGHEEGKQKKRVGSYKVETEREVKID